MRIFKNILVYKKVLEKSHVLQAEEKEDDSIMFETPSNNLNL
jgi:hypothetical protein